MSTKRVSRDDIDKFYDYNLNIPARIVYVGSHDHNEEDEESGTDYRMAEYAIKGLQILDTTQGDITVILNNLGGSWYHGMAIYDAIKACRNPVEIRVFGYAMSMGSVILQAADKRVLTPNAKLMIHYGSSGALGHVKNFVKWAEEDKKLMEIMEDLYLEKIHEKNPTFKREKLKKMLDFDTFLTARESVNLGLADEILGDSDE